LFIDLRLRQFACIGLTVCSRGIGCYSTAY